MDVTVIMPTDKEKYEIGWNYLKQIGNHILWLRCIDFIEGQGFIFEELLDIPILWTWLQYLT